MDIPFDATVFDEGDELDIMMLVSYQSVKEECDVIHELNSLFADTLIPDEIETDDIIPDDSDVSQIGEAAEEYIDSNSMYNWIDDEDDKLLDMMMDPGSEE